MISFMILKEIMTEWRFECAVKITLEESKIISQIIEKEVIYAEDCVSALPKLKDVEGNIRVIQTPNNVFLFIKSHPDNFIFYKTQILDICKNFRDINNTLDSRNKFPT